MPNLPMPLFLVLAMSLRKDSLNKKLARNAHALLKASGADAELLELNEFPMPVYDGDIEAAGIPAGVTALAAKIAGAQALVVCTPEYNGGMPGPFKNAVDWISRVRPMPWAGKHVLLLGASPGALGAVRGLWHSRQPLEVLGCFVYPEVMGLPQAGAAFEADGKLKDPAFAEKLGKLLGRFREHVSR